MVKASTVTVFMLRTDREAVALRLTRVPCVGELIHMRDEDARWRVTAVTHIPEYQGFGEDTEVAEIRAELDRMLD